MAISSIDAIQIAQDLKRSNTDKIPDWLSREDKEAVKETLKYLRAADLAIRTWYIKEQVIAAQKKVYTLKEKQLQIELKSVSKRMNLDESYFKKYDNLKFNRIKHDLEICQLQKKHLTEGEALRYADLQEKLNRNAVIFYQRSKNVIVGKPVVEFEYLAKQLYHDKPIVFQNEIKGDAYLKKLYQSRVSIIEYCFKEMLKLGVLPNQVEAWLKNVIRQEEINYSRTHLKKLMKQYNEEVITFWDKEQVKWDAAAQKVDIAQQNKTELEKKQKIAGAIYIIAALGDALQELGQQLQY